MEIPLNQAWVEATSLVLLRTTVFVFIAPPFNNGAFPARIKVMVALALAIAVSPKSVAGYELHDTAGYLLASLAEMATGAVLAVLVLVVFAAVQSAGTLIDLFGGFQMAMAFDPQSLVNGAQFTRLFQMAGMALLLASDAYQVVIAGFLGSLDAIGVGQGLDFGPSAQMLVAAASAMFVAAVQIAAPMLAVLFLADVGLGLVTRVAPALNAFAMGFPLKILLTLTFVGLVFVGLPQIISTLAREAFDLMQGVGA